VQLLTLLLKHPYIDSNDLISELEVSKPTASKLLQNFVDTGIISSIDKSKQRYVTHWFDKYIDILKSRTETK
jgi:predicted transcriptional regulator